MLAASGDAGYGDVMEQIMYNSGISGMSVDGTLFCYTNPLRWYGKEHRLLSSDTPGRWFTHRCYCCPPQVARTVSKIHRWACSVSDRTLWLHLYGGSHIEADVPGAGRLVAIQETDYPWEGVVKLTIREAPDAPLTLKMRIPGWSRAVAVTAAAKAIKARPGDYAEIARRWRAGDEVTVELDMTPQLVQAHPRVEQDRSQVAVRRGPVVYCLEEPDLPVGVRIHEVYLPSNVAFTPRYRGDFLGGVTVLEGKAVRVRETPWGSQLYRPVDKAEREEINVTLVPYYAWHNRGDLEMSVWLPTVG
jgi:DUF1680 family protein